jgi:hypothetical protein
MAKGDDGRQCRGRRRERRSREQGIRRPARRRRGAAGHAARGEDAAQEGAARARRAAGGPRDSKKGQGAEPGLLANEEKAAMAEALRPRWKLCEVLPVAVMARSSCGCARNAQAKGETERHAAARKAVIGASGASGGTCGCRRIYAQASADAGDGAAIGGRTVRSIMEEENLAACAARKERRCSSYESGISEAPESLLRDEQGRHRFHADKPSELRVADVAGFRIPAGRACLPPVAGCSAACR